MQTFKQTWLLRLLWAPAQDIGLLFLRLTGTLLLLYVHGLPKVINFANELQHIDALTGAGRYSIDAALNQLSHTDEA